MSHLEEHVAIACPLAQAAPRIRRFFRDNGSPGGDTAQIDLHVDLTLPGLGPLVDLQRSVIVTLQERERVADTTPRYQIQWAPATRGPFPLFSGELRVDEWTDYDSFTLRLVGDYAPPLGLAGDAFDLALGKRIATRTAVDLLGRIKTAIERGYESDEAEKPRTGT